MLRRKYTKDYQTDLSLGPKGRMQKKTTYIGEYFDYDRDESFVFSARLRLTVLTALATLTLLPILFHSELLQQYYTVLPTLLCFIALYLLWASVYRLFTVQIPATREQRDKIAHRIPGGAFVLLVLSALSLVGCVVFAVRNSMQTADWVTLSCSALRVAVAVPIVLQRKAFAMSEVTKNNSYRDDTVE